MRRKKHHPKRIGTPEIVPSIRFKQLNHEIEALETALKEKKRQKWAERQKLIRRAWRTSPELIIWTPGEPPMTYRDHEKRLERRRRNAAKQKRVITPFSLDYEPLPGDKIRREQG